METKITRENISTHLLSFELALVGKDISILLEDDKWKFNHPLSFSQFEMFQIYAIKLIKKTYKCNRKKAENTFEFFWKEFGLRLKK